MPPFPAFATPHDYYATLLHELVHLTKHPSRLDRDCGRKQWGDEGYAMEELVAEVGSAFLCADLGITTHARDDHASYIASWLAVLKNDKRAIFHAAAMAERAAGWLHDQQPGAGDDETHPLADDAPGAAHRRPPLRRCRLAAITPTRRSPMTYRPERIDGAVEWAKLSPDVQSTLGEQRSSWSPLARPRRCPRQPGRAGDGRDPRL